MLLACVAWLVLCVRYPGLWLVLLPAALPVASLAPWTGWLLFDEFDILVACTIAAGCMHRLFQAERRESGAFATAIFVVVAVLGGVGVYRGMADAGSATLDLFQGYTAAGNSLRLVKPLLYTLLVWLVLGASLRDPASSARAVDRLATGMLIGLGFVLLAALHERLAYPGWLNFSSPYRTVALFWEMHVGGAAIDAYLALATPFVAWALWTARTAPRWGGAAVLMLLTEYACLTTFSRGVYLAVLGPLLALGALLARRGAGTGTGKARPSFRGRSACSRALLVAMLLQAVLVFGSDSFMLRRVGSSDRDLRHRLAHWQHGVDQLRTPADWWLGIGLGRLPTRYAATVAGGEFPGSLELDAQTPDAFVRLSGPRSLPRLGGLFALTQRVPIDASPPLNVRLDIRASQPVRLRLSVCELHLLYEQRCQEARVLVEPTAGAWRTTSARLEGPALATGAWYARRATVFAVSVIDANAAVELDHLSLSGTDGIERLHNGGFTRQLSGWFPAASDQFLPWHIDNLYLELLIERGLTSLLGFLLLVGFAAWRLAFGPARSTTIAPFLLASLAGAMTLGLVSSILDVPRVAFGLCLVILASLSLKPQ
jgi:hypothetical protein